MIRIIVLLIFICYVSKVCSLCSSKVTGFASKDSLGENPIKDTSTIEYALVASFKRIQCCTNTFRHIQWAFKSRNDSIWRPFHHIPNHPSLLAGNQILQFRRIGWNNEGTYRCSIFTANKTRIEKFTELNIYSCIDRQVPEVFGPKSEYSEDGKTLTLICTVDVGCADNAAVDISWHDAKWNDLLDKDEDKIGRFNVMTTKRNHNTIIESSMTVHSVQELDPNTIFQCHVSWNGGNKTASAKLQRTDLHITTAVTKTQRVALITLAVVVLSCTVVCLKILFYHIKLLLYTYTSCGKLESLEPTKEFHTFIIHEDQDREIAERIKLRLENDSYCVTMCADIEGGKSEMKMVQTKALESQSLIIIYPSEADCCVEFTRICSAQQYFRIKQITVITRKHEPIFENWDVLDDPALTKLVLPEQGCCMFVRESTFFCRLKLRLPKVGDKRHTCMLHSEIGLSLT